MKNVLIILVDRMLLQRAFHFALFVAFNYVAHLAYR